MNLSKRSVVAFFFGLLVSGCDTADKYEYNYKITVSVEANGRTYSGSTIQQIINYKVKDWATPLLGLGGGDSSEQKGEAVVVNVDGKYLFLLVNISPYGLTGKLGDDAINKFKYNKSWEITDLKDYPFVVFTDIGDPLTVKKITQDNFGQYFMGGKITSIEVQKTNEPVTYGKVEQVIPWIRYGMRGKSGERKQPLFDADTKNYDINTYYSRLSVADFIQE